jgi:hypothetical protein
MENIIILMILIVAMEFATDSVKKQLSVLPIFKKYKSKIVPFLNLLLMTILILGTGITLIASLSIQCNLYVDYLVTILICSLGTNKFHDFKKKVEEVKNNE